MARSQVPLVSVIIPLLQHGGFALRSITGWAHEQTYQRDRYEVIVVSHSSESTIENQVRALLTENDAIVRDEGTDHYCALTAGARVARGDILFFSESHVLPEPDCVLEMVRFLSAADFDGASARSIGGMKGAFGEAQERLYAENDTTVLQDSSNWRKLASRAFALRRHVYDQFGLFDTRYDLFAARAFNIRLYKAGVKIGYASRSVARHCDAPRVSILVNNARMYITGESRYRQDHDEAEYLPYIGGGDEWENRACYVKELARKRLRCLMAYSTRAKWKLGNWRQLISVLGRALSLIPVAVAGGVPRYAQCRMRASMLVRLLKLTSHFSRELTFHLLKRLWHYDLARFLRLEYLVCNEYGIAYGVRSEQLVYRAPELKTGDAIGFHLNETRNSVAFRWSHPDFLMRVFVARGDYSLELEIVPGLVNLDELDIVAQVDGRSVSQAKHISDSLLVFDVDAAVFDRNSGDGESATDSCREHCLAVSLVETRFRNDPRPLGIPVISATFKPRTGACPAELSAIHEGVLAGAHV